MTPRKVSRTMSAAVNDRPHDVFSSRPHLPLTGELHPLRREFERLLATGNAVALTFVMLACALVYVWPRDAELLKLPTGWPEPRVVSPLPPPIAPTGRNDTQFEAPAVIQGPVEYEPVDNEHLQDPGPMDRGGGGGDGEGAPGDTEGPYSGWGMADSIVVPEPPAPSPEYNWWTEAPVLISIQPSEYPRMVRDAGIDGDVLVRVLIGVNGRVKDAYVLEGSGALREAALESARTAIFKPALQGVQPVEVWVVIPISFELRGR